jgi:hypothetical protein
VAIVVAPDMAGAARYGGSGGDPNEIVVPSEARRISYGNGRDRSSFKPNRSV